MRRRGIPTSGHRTCHDFNLNMCPLSGHPTGHMITKCPIKICPYKKCKKNTLANTNTVPIFGPGNRKIPFIHFLASRKFSKMAVFALSTWKTLLRHILRICYTILTIIQKLGNHTSYILTILNMEGH